MSRARTLALLICLTAAPHLPGTAQAEEIRVEGNWVFKAWVGNECDFTGVATLDRLAETNNTYSCELTARQECPDRTWTVRQTCAAKRDGNRIAIRSQIEEFLGPSTGNYLPDDFLLTIASSERMFGALHSAGIHKAEWLRDEGAIS